VCLYCEGKRTTLGAGPDRGNPVCKECGGTGRRVTPPPLEGEVWRWVERGGDWRCLTSTSHHVYCNGAWLLWQSKLTHQEQAFVATLVAERARVAELEQDVANEQHDIHMIAHEVSLVYDHITGGLIGKVNTKAFEVIAVADEHYQRYADEQEKEAREELAVEVRVLEQRVEALTALVESAFAEGHRLGWRAYWQVSDQYANQMTVDDWNLSYARKALLASARGRGGAASVARDPG
jgi:hypothetical protein